VRAQALGKSCCGPLHHGAALKVPCGRGLPQVLRELPDAPAVVIASAGSEGGTGIGETQLGEFFKGHGGLLVLAFRGRFRGLSRPFRWDSFFRSVTASHFPQSD
jgi:hypothetical protein